MKKRLIVILTILSLTSCNAPSRPIEKFLPYETVDLSNGERYAYRKYGNGKQKVLLIHGNYSSSLFYYPFLTRNSNDFTFYAVDLRGFGESSYKNEFNSIGEIALDLEDFILKIGLDTLDIVGWSFGGAVALKLAANLKDRVNHLVLIESAKHTGFPVSKRGGGAYSSKEEMKSDPTYSVPGGTALASGNKAFIRSSLIQSMWSLNLPKEIDTYVDEAMKERCLYDVNWSLATFNMGFSHNGYSEGDGSIKDISAKTLITTGLKDYVTPIGWAFEIKNNIANSTIYQHDGGHSPLTDDPDSLYSDIKGFLKN